MIGFVNCQEKNKSAMLSDMMQGYQESIMRLIAWLWSIKRRWESWKPGGEDRFEFQDPEVYMAYLGYFTAEWTKDQGHIPW